MNVVLIVPTGIGAEIEGISIQSVRRPVRYTEVTDLYNT